MESLSSVPLLEQAESKQKERPKSSLNYLAIVKRLGSNTARLPGAFLVFGAPDSGLK